MAQPRLTLIDKLCGTPEWRAARVAVPAWAAGPARACKGRRLERPDA